MKKAIFILSVLFGASAFAGVPAPAPQTVEGIKAEWDACLQDENNFSTAGMSFCNATAYDDADQLLNKTYREIKLATAGSDEYSKEIWNRVLTAQRAWVTYKEANCQMQGAQMLGGTAEGPMITGCLVTMTLDRVVELQDTGFASLGGN